MYRLRAKRTLGSTYPLDILFGELAYSDADQQFYIGRPTGPPATFISDLTPITDDIEALGTTATDQALELAALTTSQTAQDTAIAALTTDLATLDSSQTTQDTAINALTTSDAAQDTAIASLILNDGAQAAALGALATDTTAALATKLEAPAIASFETSAQLDTRDTVNRARGNHTGSQPANTITGLAAVATSGAYGDLSGKPVTALNYDQQTEPISPSVGQVWRERDSGGLIVGEWEWSGSLWLRLTTQWDSIEHPPGTNITATTTATSITKVMLSYSSVLITKVVFNILMLANPDAANYWDVSMRIENINYSTLASSIGTNTNTSLNSSTYSLTIKTPNTVINANRVRLSLTKFGAAPTINRANMQYSFRQAR